MIQHKEQAKGLWFKRTLAEQMANIGSEVIRAIKWKNKGNQAYSRNALYRALELIDLTVNDPKNKKFSKLKEILRTREVLLDFFLGENIYQSTDENFTKYFMFFNYLANIKK